MKKVEISGASEAVVDRLIASGRCDDVNQVVEISLRLLDREEMEREEKLAFLRKGIAEGMEDVKAGRVEPLDMEAIIRECEENHSRKISDI